MSWKDERCDMPGCGEKATRLSFADRFGQRRFSALFCYCDGHSAEEITRAISEAMEANYMRRVQRQAHLHLGAGI